MNTRTRKIFICLLFIAVFISFLSISANAYQVYLSSFQSTSGLTGEIYGHDIPGPNTFFLCAERLTTVIVPGTYNAYNTALTGGFLQAAWLMDTYAPSLHGAYGSYGGYTYNQAETAAALQLAMWQVEGQGQPASVPLQFSTLRDYLISTLVTAPSDLTYLQSFYARMNLSYLTGADAQDLIRPVPIPAAAWLLGSGLIGLVIIRRRMKK